MESYRGVFCAFFVVLGVFVLAEDIAPLGPTGFVLGASSRGRNFTRTLVVSPALPRSPTLRLHFADCRDDLQL